MPDQPESPREILKRYALALMENAQDAVSNEEEYEISEDLLDMMGVMEENGAAVSKLILELLDQAEYRRFEWTQNRRPRLGRNPGGVANRETVFGPPSLPEENDGLWQTGVKSDVSGCLHENRPMSWGPWSPTALTSGVLPGWCSARWPTRRKTQRVRLMVNPAMAQNGTRRCICCRRGYNL